MQRSATARVPARAAIAGNPSDGYLGAVLSVMVEDLAAEVTVNEHGPRATVPIVDATLAALADHHGDPSIRQLRAHSETSIPRSVGLAGSSALVIATIRAVNAFVGVEMAVTDVATLAHRIERVDLAIPGGWQDQIVQSHGRDCLMSFEGPAAADVVVTPVDTSRIPFFVAWTESPEPSGVVHADLRQRMAAESAGALRDAMHRSADCARRAREAIVSHSVHDLKEAINATYDLRASMMTLDPRHASLVAAARAHGASANSAGSGGAIVGVLPKAGEIFVDAMARDGHQILTWQREEPV